METVLIHLAIICGITMILFFAAWLFSVLCLLKDKVRKKITETNDFALERAFHRLSVWRKSTILWMIAEYVFVIVPFISNVIVIYLTNVNMNQANNEVVLLHSIISLSFIVFGYAINPQRHKKCYRRAFSCLDACINEYLSKLDNGNPNSNILNKGMKDGEGFIDVSCDIE